MPEPIPRLNIFQRMLTEAANGLDADERLRFYQQIIVALCFELDQHGRDVPRVLANIIVEKRP